MPDSSEIQQATPMTAGRFFDNRAAYMMFTTTTNEKPMVVARIDRELSRVSPGERALRVLDAGMGDASVLSHLMRRMHKVFPHIPWLVIGKEISIEDMRLALDRLPDRFFEHPELVFVATNMYYREAPSLTPLSRPETPLVWREAGLEGSNADDFARQIRDLFADLAHDWEVRTSPNTGNPLYVRPSVLVLYRKDHEFLLRPVIPRAGEVEGLYDLIVAAQPYRARTSAESKVRSVLVPLTGSLAPGGKLIGVHSYGEDPGLEIVRGVWPNEDPFRTRRAEILEETKRHMSDDTGLTYPKLDDEESIFRYELHAMPSQVKEHIGTSLTLAAWNAAAYVAQIDEERLSEAMTSGAYMSATRDVLQRHGGVWFNDESYLIERKR